MKLTRLISLLFVLALAVGARAQVAGTVGIATNQAVVCWSAPCVTAATATGTSLIGKAGGFRNIGQGAHYLTYCYTGGGNVSNLQIWLEESFDGSTNWIPFTAVGTTSGTFNGNCNELQGGGYFNYIRAHIGTFTANGGSTVTAWYSSSAAPLPLNQVAQGSNGTFVPSGCDHSTARVVADNSQAVLVGSAANSAVYVCSAVITYNGTPAQTGTIKIFTQLTGGGCAGTPANFQAQFFTGSAAPIAFGGGVGTIFGSPFIFDLCVVTAGVGASAMVSIGFTQY